MNTTEWQKHVAAAIDAVRQAPYGAQVPPTVVEQMRAALLTHEPSDGGRPSAAAVERCRLLDELIASWRDKSDTPEERERRIQARLAVEAAWAVADGVQSGSRGADQQGNEDTK